MSADKSKIAKQFMQALPHAQALGMRLSRMGDGTAEIEMDYDCLLYTSDAADEVSPV